jgi:Na+-driven multidrug efflux pump
MRVSPIVYFQVRSNPKFSVWTNLACAFVAVAVAFSTVNVGVLGIALASMAANCISTIIFLLGWRWSSDE